MNRALPIAAVSEGETTLRHILISDDTKIMIEAMQSLGIEIQLDPEFKTARIRGAGGPFPATKANLHCGNSGTTMRFLTAQLAAAHGRFELDGVARMRERPIGLLGEAVAALGAGVDYAAQHGYPPIVIYGQGLDGGQITLRDVPSSQMVSALLMAAPLARRDVLIEVRGKLPSRPYVDTTLSVMEAFGTSVLSQTSSDGQTHNFIIPAPQYYRATTYDIEPDASSASYFLAAAAITGGSIRIEGLLESSVQGDAAFAEMLGRMGCRIEWSPQGVRVNGPDDRLHSLDVDLNDMPDMVQTLAVTALFAEGTTVIRNIENLRIKETDRLTALQSELGKLGANVITTADSISITPPDKIKPASIQTYDDHRMAMSFALAGLQGAAVLIEDPGCCSKTNPTFFRDFENMLG